MDKILWTDDYCEVYYQSKVNTQTVDLAFQLQSDGDRDTYQWNIALIVYSKRKDISNNFVNGPMTGKTVGPLVKASRVFDNLVNEILEVYPNKSHIFYCYWLDNKRRDAYYRFLSKKGYKYGFIENKKVIYKKVEVNK